MIRTILVPTDGSRMSEAARRFAGELAKASGAKVVVLGVVHPHHFANARSFMEMEALRREVRRTVEAEVRELQRAGVRVSHRVDQSTKVHLAIRRAAKESGADLIVMGTHSRTGFDRTMLGSVTERVLLDSTVPVTVVPPPAATVDELTGTARIPVGSLN